MIQGLFVHRAVEGHRFVVTMLGYGTGCVASGDTAQEAEEKAQRWMTNNLRHLGVRAKIGILEAELQRLCDVLALPSIKSAWPSTAFAREP